MSHCTLPPQLFTFLILLICCFSLYRPVFDSSVFCFWRAPCHPLARPYCPVNLFCSVILSPFSFEAVILTCRGLRIVLPFARANFNERVILSLCVASFSPSCYWPVMGGLAKPAVTIFLVFSAGAIPLTLYDISPGCSAAFSRYLRVWTFTGPFSPFFFLVLWLLRACPCLSSASKVPFLVLIPLCFFVFVFIFPCFLSLTCFDVVVPMLHFLGYLLLGSGVVPHSYSAFYRPDFLLVFNCSPSSLCWQGWLS